MTEARPARSAPRPAVMTTLSLFCAATVAFLVVRDLWIPEVRDVEVWFGLELHGAAAHATAPLHWAIFAVGAWAFATRRPWILPTAAGYAFYVALSHGVWNVTSPSGHGALSGLAQTLAFSLPGFALLWLHHRRALRSAG
ncbi:MAG: hypothetical protein HKP30_17080 [Myxococcales bacterium]|nr:hypothetical protein [Myxococcales bacterium]